MRKYVIVISENGAEVERRVLFVGRMRVTAAPDGTPLVLPERETAADTPRPSEC